MSKSVASESNEGHASHKTGGKTGAGDEEKQDEEVLLETSSAANSITLTTVSTAPAASVVGLIGWMETPEFHRHLLTYISLDTLLTMKVLSKEFEETTREYIRRVESGEMILHRGVDVVFDLFNISKLERKAFTRATKKRNKLVTQAVFLQNLPRIGDYDCFCAVNLVVVDIPEGVERIGLAAFCACRSLTTVSFTTTLTSIRQYAFRQCSCLEKVDLLHTNLEELGECAFAFCDEVKSTMIPDSLQMLGGGVFYCCSKLENVDLLHTNLQEIGKREFQGCSELKSRTIPDSLQTLGFHVFHFCSKLVPCSIDVSDLDDDTTSEVVGHLRSEMSLNALLSGNNFLNTDDFRRLIVPYLPNDALMPIRLASKPWSRVADALIDEGVRSCELMVHGGNDISWTDALKGRRKLVTPVVFLLNTTKVGERACQLARNLVVVDIPEGIEEISEGAFRFCRSLTTVSFPTTLTFIGYMSFEKCSSLENVDLRQTNLQELGRYAFDKCSKLKSMMIPDSLKTLGHGVFRGCSKLQTPSNIRANGTNAEVAYLRSLQT